MNGKPSQVDIDYCYLSPTVSCLAPPVPSNAHISNRSSGVYIERTKVTIQCDNVSHTALTTVCQADGSWTPPPSELDCNPSGNNNYHTLTIIAQ